jgi:hypothetical protein
MMGSLSDYAENALLDHVLGTTPFSVPTIYIGLSIADPLDDASGNDEPVGNGYTRVAHAAWDAATARAIENTGTCTFPTASGSWGELTHWTIWDAATVGNMLAHGSLAAPKTVVSGNTPSIADAEMVVTFSASGSGGGWMNFLVHEVLDHVFGNGTYAAPSIYWGLSTTTPADDGTGITEHAGDGYARELHAAYDAAAAGASENTGAITFDAPSASWGTITHCVAFDALTVGNALMWGDVPDNLVGVGDTVSFADGALDLTLS